MRDKKVRKLALNRETIRELSDQAMAAVNGGVTRPIASVDICTYVSWNRCSDMPGTAESCVFPCDSDLNCGQTRWDCV